MALPAPLVATRLDDAPAFAAEGRGLDGGRQSNVVPFVRPSRRETEQTEPAGVIAAVERCIPERSEDRGRMRLWGLLIASLVLHAGLLALLSPQVPPLPSVELPAISVDIVIGEKAQPDAPPPASKEKPNPAVEEPAAAKDIAQPEVAEPAAATSPDKAEEPTARAPEEPAAPPAEESETRAAPEPAPPPTESPMPRAAEEPPPPTAAERAPPTAAIEAPPLTAEPEPAPAGPPARSEPVPPAPPVVTATPPRPAPIEDHARRPTPPKEKPARHRIAPAAEKKPERAAKPPERAASEKPAPARTRESGEKSQRASSEGRGAPKADPNYYGSVAAHLAHYKQYPAEARGNRSQGVATISFGVDGSGRVTSVRLVRGTGVPSLDREAEAMPHRASPFPAPPSGRPMNFTVPVSFVMH